MIEKTYQITDPIGIHARPAAKLVAEIKDSQSEILFKKGEKSANAKSLLAIMGLGAKEGDTITISAEGPDAEETVDKILAFLKANL